MPESVVDNDKFVSENFEKLVRKYPRQCIAISNGEVFTGKHATRKARQKYPALIPKVLPVPPKGFFERGFLL